MGLKKLEIIGFKSFAKRTEILFSDGINAIVGPNGCGKSNIVDSFLWALGEQSARTLRGSKMHDVIFAGSEKQKGVHFAEVTITFDNSDHYLPINYDEVSVTRRIYRDQGSEYLLNKQDVRLRDIQDLFASTGLAHETFAVIGQGRVEKIISQSPQERRTMFEEVAGILHFLIKRKESERKLELTQTNVDRACDIVKEVQAQKVLLEKQAQDAKKFQKDQARLAISERRLCELKLSKAELAYKTLVEQLQGLQEQKAQHEKQEEECKRNLLEKKEALKVQAEAVFAASQRLERLQSSHALFTKEVAHNREAALAHQTKQANCHRECVLLQERLSTIDSEKKSIDARKQVLDQMVIEKQKDFEVIDTRFRTISTAFSEKEAAIKALHSKRYALQNQSQMLEVDAKKALLAEEVALEKRKARTASVIELQQRLQQCNHECEEKTILQAAATQRSAEKKEQQIKLTEQIQAIDVEIKEHMRAQEECRRALVDKETRSKVLERQLFDMEGFSSAAKLLCMESKKIGSNLFGKVVTLVECFEVDAHPAFSLIGSLYESTLVVKTTADLELCLAKLDKKQEVSFVVLEFLGLLDDVQQGVSVSEKASLKAHLLQAISLTDSIKTLDRDSWPALVNEWFVDALGVICIGREKEHNLLDRKRQAKKLKEEAETSACAFKQMEEALGVLQDKKSCFVAKKVLFEEEIRKVDFEVSSLRFHLQELKKQQEQFSKEIERFTSEIKSFDALLETLKGQQEGFELKSAECKAALELVLSESSSKEEEYQGLKREYEALIAQRNSAVGACHEVKTERQKVYHAFDLISSQEQDVAKRLSYFTAELEQVTTVQNECDSKEKEALASLVGIKQEQAIAFQEQKVKQEVLKVCENEVATQEELLVTLQKQRELFVATLSGKEVEKQHVVTEQEQYRLSLSSLELPENISSDFFELDAALTIGQLEEQCRRFRNAIERNRNVNLMAIDELDAVTARLDQLEKQLSDLATAKQELLGIISSLEKESVTTFKETFDKIRSSFIRHFQTLFNGGDADLLLTESHDLLQTGIEIVAKPPGKQMRSMQLLSGGEKSLTALALLFACFDVRPSPFCILDEVDAALDEANVERLGALLSSFSGNLQFLVITHNKRTMARADTLIGVSMQEKGVSQIISLDFKKSEKPLAENAQVS